VFCLSGKIPPEKSLGIFEDTNRWVPQNYKNNPVGGSPELALTYPKVILKYFKIKKNALKKSTPKYQKLKKPKYHPKRIKTKDIKKNIINTFKQLHLRLGQTRKDRIDVRYMTGGLVDHLREKCQTK